MLKEAISRLEEFRTLVQGWNGYGGTPPSGQAIDECIVWLLALPKLAFPPTAMVSGDGEVGLLWELATCSVSLEVGFKGNGTCGFLTVTDADHSFEAEGIPIHGLMPMELAMGLSSFLL